MVVSAEAEEIVDGLFYLSGEIPRRSFERGFQTHYRQAADGHWEEDPWIMDERFLAAHVQGKGIAIFTGCSHAGVVNICRHAQEVFPGIPLYALVGGLHLGACLGISIQVTSMDDQSVQLASIRPQCSFAPIPAA